VSFIDNDYKYLALFSHTKENFVQLPLGITGGKTRAHNKVASWW
jgi:hypothetical protein